jgi:hypothetical protein
MVALPEKQHLQGRGFNQWFQKAPLVTEHSFHTMRALCSSPLGYNLICVGKILCIETKQDRRVVHQAVEADINILNKVIILRCKGIYRNVETFKCSNSSHSKEMIIDQDYASFLNCKHHTPSIMEKPQTLVDLMQSVIQTHNPIWTDCLQLLLTLFNTEEWHRITQAALK